MRLLQYFLFLSAFSLIYCTESGDQKATTTPGTTSVPDGKAIFNKHCVQCHGADGKMALNGAKDITQSSLMLGDRIFVITNGRNLMTPFKGQLTEEEIKAVALYSIKLDN